MDNTPTEKPTRTTQRAKTVYCLSVRPNDQADWSEPSYYQTRKERDRVAATNRILGGIRTHSYEEKRKAEELAEIFDLS